MPKDPKLEAYLTRLSTSESVRVLFRRHGLRFRWIALLTISLANIATLSSSTMINVAIPNIMVSFKIGQNTAQWLSSIFLATSTVSMLLSAWLTQYFGIQKTVMLAMAIFVIGSVLGSVSPNIETMVAARMLQGASTGIITPLSMSLIFHLYPPGKQGFAMGISTAAMMIGPAIGPTVGGLLVDTLSWHYVFIMSIPFSLLVLPLACLYLPQRNPYRVKLPFDWPGVLLISFTISFLLLGLGTREQMGWTSGTTLGRFGLAALFLTFFIWRETNCLHPILQLKVFCNSRFSLLAIVSFVFGAGMYGSTYLIPLFLQIGQGLSATQSGFLLLPASVLMGLCFPLGGRLADEVDVRWLITIGFLAFAYSSYLFVYADQYTQYYCLLVWIIIGRLGIGILAPALSLASLRCLPPELLQHGAGASPFIRQLGGAFGVSLVSVYLDRRTAFHLDAIQGFHDSFIIITIIFTLTLIPTWILRREKLPK